MKRKSEQITVSENNTKQTGEIPAYYAALRVLETPVCADKIYTYQVPVSLSVKPEAGDFVVVPFGAGNRLVPAVVTETDVIPATDTSKIKSVEALLERQLSLDPGQLALCRFVADRSVCTLGEAIRAVVPVSALSRLCEYYTANENTCNVQLNDAAASLYEFIKNSGRCETAAVRKFAPDYKKPLASLIKSGLVTRELAVNERENVKSVELPYLNDAESARESLASLKSEGQRHIIEALLEYKSDGESPARSVLLEKAEATAAQLNALVKAGLVGVKKIPAYRNPYAGRGINRGKPSLSEAQTRAFESIAALYDTHTPKAALLFGVTGSGKTQVIRAMIDRVIADGRTVIVLVPEIALTPQTVDIFCGAYGDRVAVIHSSLSDGERLDAWRRIKAGEADIVIGTRSAIFAPLENIGMIVIDEEQEHTYKSDSDPKYHARDIAAFRCGQNNALMLLSSATPSLESYYKAQNGTYTLVPLTERYGNARLPRVTVADMRTESRAGNSSPYSAALITALSEAYHSGHQAIIFANRRGYNNFLYCHSCGAVVGCPNCSVSMTYHTRRPFTDTELESTDIPVLKASGGSLKCHYCGYTMPIPPECPSCKKGVLTYIGYGTQKAEEELLRLIPGIRTLRMDADVTGTKFSHEEIIGRFRRGEADVLIGTQMVTKGHDFPAVTVVGVLTADASLYIDDYRAGERTFSTVTQVIGRAGRADNPGTAVIQTFAPENPVITAAAAQDYVSFYENEIRMRRTYNFPPFCDIVSFALSSENESLLGAKCTEFASLLTNTLSQNYPDIFAVLYGPLEAPVYKIKGRYHMRCLLKCVMNRRTREFVFDVIKAFPSGEKFTLAVDVNPGRI